MNSRSASLCIAMFASASMALSAMAQDAGGSDTGDLAKAAQNPVGDLVSLPLQNNMQFGVGPDDRVLNVLNIQPVYPFKLNDDWNLITRTILPVISSPVPGTDRTNGLGDLNFTAFFSPSEPGKVIWGVGPVLSFPTATDELLGTDRYSGGISAVALTMPGNWVVGALASQVWDYAGADDGTDVNSFLFQYFINYNFPSGWYFTSAPIMTANWDAPSGEKWSIPIGGGAGKIVRLGKLPLNINSQLFYYVEKPTGGPDWEWRFQVQAMFPK
jgi:hypothetical protein